MTVKKGRGGYYIKEHPSKTSIAAVVRIVNGPIAVLPRVSLYFYEKCKYCDERNCCLRDIMENVRDAKVSILETRTLDDLATVRIPELEDGGGKLHIKNADCILSNEKFMNKEHSIFPKALEDEAIFILR